MEEVLDLIRFRVRGIILLTQFLYWFGIWRRCQTKVKNLRKVWHLEEHDSKYNLCQYQMKQKDFSYSPQRRSCFEGDVNVTALNFYVINQLELIAVGLQGGCILINWILTSRGCEEIVPGVEKYNIFNLQSVGQLRANKSRNGSNLHSFALM